MPGTPAPPAVRFWRHVDQRAATECWPWTGGTNQNGYGTIGVNGTTRKAHRLSYEMHHGPIPRGLVVRHHCDNPACVNPAHLALGTLRDNSQDMVARGRHGRQRHRPTHCIHGHPFTAENTRIRRNGARTCATCDRAACRARYYRRTAASRINTGW